MSLQNDIAGEAAKSSAFFSGSIVVSLLRLGGLAILDAFALWFCYQLFGDGNAFLAITIAIVTVGLNIVFLFERFYPFRWLSPGLALIIIMVIYPTMITVYYAFTNYSTGNLLTRPLAIERIQEKAEYRFLPEGEQYYDMTAFRNMDGEYLLWLVGRDNGEIFTTREGDEVVSLSEEQSGLAGIEILESEEMPSISIEGFNYVSSESVPELFLDQASIELPAPIGIVEITSFTPDDEFEEGYRFDPEQRIFGDFNGRRPTIYDAQIFESDNGLLAYWLVEDDGDATILIRPDQPVAIDGLPYAIDGYTQLESRDRITAGQELPTRSFGTEDNPMYVDPFSAGRAGRFRQQFVYDADRDVMIDQLNGAEYEPVEGTFTLIEGTANPEAEEVLEELTPGYFVPIGFDNFARLFNDERLRGPFATIFIWTIVHGTHIDSTTLILPVIDDIPTICCTT